MSAFKIRSNSSEREFLFGIAESDLQTVGSKIPQLKEKAQQTAWEIFARQKKIEQPLQGSHKYDKYQEDSVLIADLGVKAYRTSISMSRIRDKNGNLNKRAIRWYRNYFSQIKRSGIQIHACLYHWELPAQFTTNGILDSYFSGYYLEHAKIVLEYFSDLIDYYIPLNEAWCIAYLSYYRGIHAPGRSSLRDFFHAFGAVLDLQTKAVHAIKDRSPDNKVGLVNIHFPSFVREKSSEYLNAKNIADEFTNFMYLDPIFKGSISPIIKRQFSSYFPDNFLQVVKSAKVGDEIDYYGVNYYNSNYVRPSDSELGYELDDPDEVLRNSLGWPISIKPYYPNGLSYLLQKIYVKYASYGLSKLMISENGTPGFTDVLLDGSLSDDNFRIFYLNEHLKQVKHAIQKGVPIEGYFLWTLLDNYEWQEGYRPESAFGIVHVDRKTGKRVPKKSYFWYQKYIRDQLK